MTAAPRITNASTTLSKWVEHCCAFALAGIFVWAAIPKLQNPQLFAESIHNYRLLPPDWTRILAMTLPPMELVSAMAVLWPRLRIGGAAILTGMLLAFCVAMISAIQRGVNIECGCFGSVMKADVSWLSIARNLGICCLALPVWINALRTQR